MNLYKNGYVVAKMNSKDASYSPWPLFKLTDDKTAQELTDMSYDNWFAKYHMRDIVPDLGYIKLYFDYCNSIGLNVKVLLFESQDNTIIVNDEIEICEVLGYDCIENVDYSYLQTEYYQYPEMHTKGIFQNKYGLLDNIEDILEFIKLREQTIADGINIEAFWMEPLVKVSIINPL